MIRFRESRFWPGRGLLLAIGVLAGAGLSLNAVKKMNFHRQMITVYHPVSFMYPMDPRKINTVGDQVLSEHIFAFHSRESFRQGFQPVFSDVDFNPAEAKVTIHPKYPLRRSDGKSVPIESICASIEASFNGTQHAPYRSIFKSVECKDEKVIIHLTKIPVNLRFLLTLPDFSIYETNGLPVSRDHLLPTTGPYSVQRIENSEVWLKRNPYYPAELTANQVDNVVIHSYKSGETPTLVEEAKPETHHLLYFGGEVFSEGEAQKLKAKGYKLNYFPSEWLAYIAFHPRVPLSDRHLIAAMIDSNRDQLMKAAPIGQKAFSIAPSDRPFGMTESEYTSWIQQEKSSRDAKLTKPLVIGVYPSWVKIPIFAAFLEEIQSQIPGSTVKLFGPGEMDRLDNGADIRIKMLGISPADPLNHLAFLYHYNPDFSKILSEERLTQAALIEDGDRFISNIKEIEKEIIANRLIVPIAHFPGVVAEAPGFERDESLAWSWGTQAWTYRIH